MKNGIKYGGSHLKKIVLNSKEKEMLSQPINGEWDKLKQSNLYKILTNEKYQRI